MRKILLFLLILLFQVSGLSAQRSKVIAAYQLLENGKYDEAKTAIEEATHDSKTRAWARTWYTRGLLCQTAYEKGKKDNDKKKYELYPEQLYVAYESYSKALLFDKNGRMNDQVAPVYVQLANDFLTLGKEHYIKKEFKKALKAFEHALEINNSYILSLETDTSLLYNTALAAYKGKDWDKASEYLAELNTLEYSSNVPHLLFTAQMAKKDTAAATKALSDGVLQYDYDETLVLLLADHYHASGDTSNAMILLDSAMAHKPDSASFPFTKGLIYQKAEEYDLAIKAYEKSLTIDDDNIQAYSNIANCYYNMAVDIDEKARKITNNSRYMAEKSRSMAARESAIKWLERAYEKDPLNQAVREQLNRLYQFLN